MNELTILGIETSCDDTSICLLKGDPDSSIPPQILAFRNFTQETLLRKWGGVVPEIAARNHLAKLVPLMEECFSEAHLEAKAIDLIGVTTHPGLLGPLLTGINAAKTLAQLYKIPIFGVNHLFAHLEAIHLTEPTAYPYLGLLVSGGHSIFFLVKSTSDFEVLGSTIDDAAGEAFDKGGKLLGLPYPAGRFIDELAATGDKSKYEFPVGLLHSKDATLSYSGLKSSLRVFLENHPELPLTSNGGHTQNMNDLCASYQEAIIKALLLKTKFALEKAGRVNALVVGGGVACNKALRTQLGKQFENVRFVSPKFCTDNGAMIAHYALKNAHKALPFPDCLLIDAHGRYLDKGHHNKSLAFGTPTDENS
jgi:N6-L-threonylcarbamoyladenine synthase